MVKTYIANQRAIFGVRTNHSYAHRQVSFSDRDSTPERNPKKVQEKPSSSLEDELRNLVGVVQKLSVAVNDNIVARVKISMRQISVAYSTSWLQGAGPIQTD